MTEQTHLHLGAITAYADADTPESRAHRAGRYNGQINFGAYDQPLEDFLWRKHRPHGLTWQENVTDGVVRLADGSVSIFCVNAYAGMPRGACFEPDIFRRRPGERALTRVPLKRGSYRTGAIGNGVIEDGAVSYTKAAGAQMPAYGSDKFEFRIGPTEYVFRQGDVLDLRCPKLGLTWEWYVPGSGSYMQESVFEAHGTILGQEIVYGFVFTNANFTNYGTTMWEAYGEFSGFRSGKWVSEYTLCYAMNTYNTGERELLHLFTGLDDCHQIAVQTSPAPGKPFTLSTNVTRNIKVSTSRRKDGSKRVLISAPEGDWEFVVAADGSPDSQWSWAAYRRVGDARKVTQSAVFLDHILPSLGEIKDGSVKSIKFFDIPGGEFRSGKGYAPA